MGCILVVTLWVAGCGDGPPENPEVTDVAVLDGNPVPLEDFERYVDPILSFDDDDEPLDDEDLDRVRSRLFDAFIEEETLLLEARRRGVRIEDAELDAYLGTAAPDGDDPLAAADRDRHMARRNLMIQKLRGAVVGVDANVTAEDVDAYLAEHRAELEANQQIVLRSLTVGTEANAAKVRGEIRAGKMTFSQARAGNSNPASCPATWATPCGPSSRWSESKCCQQLRKRRYVAVLTASICWRSRSIV